MERHRECDDRCGWQCDGCGDWCAKILSVPHGMGGAITASGGTLGDLLLKVTNRLLLCNTFIKTYAACNANISVEFAVEYTLAS